MSISFMILSVIIAKYLSRVKNGFFEFSIFKMNSDYENLALRGGIECKPGWILPLSALDRTETWNGRADGCIAGT